jgi:formylglycine-generating enzyme required for sulfatase activity
MTARVRALGLLAGFALVLGLFAQAPAERKDKILKLFVDELVSITPGKGMFPATFTLGNLDEPAPMTELPTVTITLKQPFAIAKYEVTQELYEAVTGKKPSRWQGPRNSVEMVNANEARDFCKLLTGDLRSAKLIDRDEDIRLPSEAEWEYCCKAGTKTRWSFGNKFADLGDHCWFKDNSPGNDPPVGAKKGNPWGLHDMHGYVWEWCEDSWSPSHKDVPTDGSPRKIADTRLVVIRGGSFADASELTTSTARLGKIETTRSDQIGFRCVKAKVKGATP